MLSVVFFFFKQKTAYEIKECDWSSGVCSSDLDIQGSRKNQEKFYTLFSVENNKVTVLAEAAGKDWAVRLWDAITNYFVSGL